MHFVKNEDLEAAMRGRELHLVEHTMDILHLVVGGCVELHHVHVGANGDSLAIVAFPAGMHGGPLLAIQRHGENTRERGLANATRPNEEVRMRDAILRNGIGECARDVILPHDVVKRLGAPLPRKDFVGHRFLSVDKGRR